MPRLPGRAALPLCVVLLTALLAAVRGLPLRKPRGPGWSHVRLAEVSGGARAAARWVPAPPAPSSGRAGSRTGTRVAAPEREGRDRPGRRRAPDGGQVRRTCGKHPRAVKQVSLGRSVTSVLSEVRRHPVAARLPFPSARRLPAAASP